MTQLEVRGAEDVHIRIARHRVEPEIRRGLAGGGAVHIVGSPIGVSDLAIPTVARVRPFELRRQVIGITAVRVREQDDAIEIFVAR